MKINGDALRKRAQQIDQFGRIYEIVESNMKWDCMRRSDDVDEGTGDYKYTAPEQEESDGPYMTDYEKYLVYQEVLKAIEKLAR